MSRHRNVRTMNYSDEYDGYDDVYGHSVEDDICMSPSQAAFMYDREGSKGKQKIAAFFQNDIAEEENEDIESKESSLSEVDHARLLSCIEALKVSVGSICSRPEMVNVILTHNFDAEKALNYILENSQNKDPKQPDKKDKDVKHVSTKNFTIPKLNMFNTKVPNALSTNFNVSLVGIIRNKDLTTNSTTYTSLSDLANNHLHKNQPNFSLNKSAFSKIDDVSNFSIPPLKLNNVNDVKSVGEIEKSSNKDSVDGLWHVDLTKALRDINSVPPSKTISQSDDEIFVPEFIDCENDTKVLQIVQDPCCMNIGYVLNTKYGHRKVASSFGKVLCRRYKRMKPYFKPDDDSDTCDIIAFKFDVPSPDDIILGHLSKNKN